MPRLLSVLCVESLSSFLIVNCQSVGLLGSLCDAPQACLLLLPGNETLANMPKSFVFNKTVFWPTIENSV
jgi:hypothetical protein